MRFCDPFRNREAEARSCALGRVPTRSCAVGPVEALENVRLRFNRNARAIVRRR